MGSDEARPRGGGDDDSGAPAAASLGRGGACVVRDRTTLDATVGELRAALDDLGQDSNLRHTVSESAKSAVFDGAIDARGDTS